MSRTYRRKYSRSGGRYQLSLYLRNPHRKLISLHNIYHCRYRNRKNPMLAPYGSSPLAHKGNYNLCNVQIIQTYRSRYNIHNRIHCPNLMEMHLLQINSMCFCLRFRQYPENADSNLPGAGSYFRSVNNLHYFRKPPMDMCMFKPFLSCTCLRLLMVMMEMLIRFLPMMVMLMSVQIFHIMVVIFMRLIQLYIKIAGIQSVFFHSADFYFKALYRKAF